MSKQRSIKPPILADKLLLWYCSQASIEDLHGDLEELFFHDVTKMPVYLAKLKYWQRTFSLMFSYAIKKRKQKGAYHHFSSTSFNPSMLKNYFLIATRNLAKHKIFTIINVFGLAVGMSISLLFIAMLSFVFTYDNFHDNKDRIYRVISETHDKQRDDEFASAPAGLGEKLKEEYSGIEKVVRINSSLRGEATYLQKKIPLSGYFADPEFLEVFTFPLVSGNMATALSKPNNLLITEKAAVKLFGNEDPINKVIELGEFGEFEITGILKDIPLNSHMQFEVIAPYQSFVNFKPAYQVDPWIEFYGSYVYLLLPQKHETKPIENFLNSVAAQVYATHENFSARFQLQALNDIAPGRELRNTIGPDWGYIGFVIFGILTLMILLPACFNYASISISRALKRMKEIGLRKVMGGQRNQIFLQFIMETVIITLISLILSYFIFVLIREEFQSMLVEHLDLIPTISTVVYFILFALFIGFSAGFVPALYFSKLNPIQALKVKPAARGLSGFTFRKVLIVSQFTLSLGFIMMVVIVMKQYRYAMSYDFGFQQENILDVELQGTDPQIFRNEFSKIPSVQSISMSSDILGTSVAGRDYVKNIEKTDSVESYEFVIDEHYLSNLKLSLVAGKNFGENSIINKQGIIVNEAFLKEIHIEHPSDALGTMLLIGNKKEAVTILGVVKNFHYMGLREPIRAFYFSYAPEKFKYANITIASQDIYGDLSQMENVWKTFGGETKFQAQFFNDEIKDAYDFYFSMIKICGFLGLLAITISCLGLLGMVVFTVENRMKEIGIRKVMGSTTGQLTLLLSRDYIKLLIIAAAIAIPVTYWLGDKYYEQMQYYRGEIGITEVLLSLAIILILGGVTILSQTIKAAKANPVDIIRYE